MTLPDCSPIWSIPRAEPLSPLRCRLNLPVKKMKRTYRHSSISIKLQYATLLFSICDNYPILPELFYNRHVSRIEDCRFLQAGCLLLTNSIKTLKGNYSAANGCINFIPAVPVPWNFSLCLPTSRNSMALPERTYRFNRSSFFIALFPLRDHPATFTETVGLTDHHSPWLIT